jgi:hypothetical protein
MKLLDGRPEVEKYSHFGAFRSNETTVGPRAAFLDASGKLTDTGRWYLGGGAAREFLNDRDYPNGRDYSNHREYLPPQKN